MTDWFSLYPVAPKPIEADGARLTFDKWLRFPLCQWECTVTTLHGDSASIRISGELAEDGNLLAHSLAATVAHLNSVKASHV